MKKLLLKTINRLHLLKSINTTHRKGETIIPIIGGMGYQNVFGTEPWMTALLKKILKVSEGIFVDVGINIGQTLIKVKEIDKNIPYIGFEPNPSCIYYVEELIRLNKYENVTIIPCAVASETKLLSLKIFADTTDSMASIIDDFKDQAKGEKKIIAIDEKLLDIPKVGVLKVDVEGAEIDVLKGMSGIIDRDNPIITLEILPALNPGGDVYEGRASRQIEIEQFFKKRKYKILRIIKSDHDNLKELKLVDEIEMYSEFINVDFLFLPYDLHKFFI